MTHFLAAHAVSQRRACAAMGFDRLSVRYRSVRPDDAEAMKAVPGNGAASATGASTLCWNGRGSR